jgi:hypothetical protein
VVASASLLPAYILRFCCDIEQIIVLSSHFLCTFLFLRHRAESLDVEAPAFTIDAADAAITPQSIWKRYAPAATALGLVAADASAFTP